MHVECVVVAGCQMETLKLGFYESMLHIPVCGLLLWNWGSGCSIPSLQQVSSRSRIRSILQPFLCSPSFPSLFLSPPVSLFQFLTICPCFAVLFKQCFGFFLHLLFIYSLQRNNSVVFIIYEHTVRRALEHTLPVDVKSLTHTRAYFSNRPHLHTSPQRQP